VDLRVSWNIVKKRNISCSCPKSNHESSVVQTVAVVIELSRHLYSGLRKVSLSSFSSSESAQTVVLLTFIWRAPVRITARTPTVLIETFRGFTQSLPANNGTLLENGSRPSPHALLPYIVATLKKVSK
jgi:hypothetical protein